MKQRPISITVIAWVMIAFGLMASASLLGAQNGEADARRHFGLMIAAILVAFTTGFALLRGKSWGRLLFLGWVVLIAFTNFSSAQTTPDPLNLVVGAVPLVLMIALLFGEKAKAFFSRGKAKAPDGEEK